MPQHSDDSASADTPSLAGSRAVVIGGNGHHEDGRSGLGVHEATGLAAAGAEVVIASRDGARGEEAVRRIRAAAPGARVRFQSLDLTDLASIRAFVERMGDTGDPLDILINSAGVQGRCSARSPPTASSACSRPTRAGRSPSRRSCDPSWSRGDDPRLVWTSSSRTGRIDFDDLQHERDYDYGRAYDDTKLANLLMAFECERRSRAAGWGITSIAVHPGVCRTDIVIDGPGLETPEGRRFQWLPFIPQDPAIGALPALYAATSPQAAGGGYCGPKELRLSGLPGLAIVPEGAGDPDLSARFWETMEDLTGLTFT